MTLHASQVPVQALLQQTPSTQLRPEVHSVEAVHASPDMPRGRHMPVMHCAPASHSASVAQLMAHIVAGLVGCDIEALQNTLG